MHQSRMYRHGSVDAVRPNRRERLMTSNGYVKVYLPAHPLADRNGRVSEHRQVLFDVIGPGRHLCHWCSRLVNWEQTHSITALVVDHLDEDRTNNTVANLVPSCIGCNSTRTGIYKLKWTHCPKGHEYTPENLVPGLPYRRCATCNYESQRIAQDNRRRRRAVGGR